MGLPGSIDSSVYRGLKDVLQRYPLITTVTYEPDSIIKRSLRARVDPNSVVPPTGPEVPTLDVEWRFTSDDTYYRIHYADPNSGFNCGWHRDDDHSDLGAVHFQYESSVVNEGGYEADHFGKSVPTELLWSALDRLFDERIPALTNR